MGNNGRHGSTIMSRSNKPYAKQIHMITVTDCPNIREKLERFGVETSDGIVLLPINFESADAVEKCVFLPSIRNVRKLFRQNGVAEVPVVSGPVFKALENRDSSFLLPTMFVAYCYWSANPDAVSIALNVVASYLFEFFKGIDDDQVIEFGVIVEREKTQTKTKTTERVTTQINFKGKPKEFESFKEAVNQALKQE